MNTNDFFDNLGLGKTFRQGELSRARKGLTVGDLLLLRLAREHLDALIQTAVDSCDADNSPTDDQRIQALHLYELVEAMTSMPEDVAYNCYRCFWDTYSPGDGAVVAVRAALKRLGHTPIYRDLLASELAWQLFRAGRTKEAIAAARRALTQNLTGDGDSLRLAADVLQKGLTAQKNKATAGQKTAAEVGDGTQLR